MKNMKKSVTSKNFHKYTPTQRRYLILQDREWRITKILLAGLIDIRGWKFYEKQACRLRAKGQLKNKNLYFKFFPRSHK